VTYDVIPHSIEDQSLGLRHLSLVLLEQIYIGGFNYHTIDIGFEIMLISRKEILAFQIT